MAGEADGGRVGAIDEAGACPHLETDDAWSVKQAFFARPMEVPPLDDAACDFPARVEESPEANEMAFDIRERIDIGCGFGSEVEDRASRLRGGRVAIEFAGFPVGAEEFCFNWRETELCDFLAGENEDSGPYRPAIGIKFDMSASDRGGIFSDSLADFKVVAKR